MALELERPISGDSLRLKPLSLLIKDYHVFLNLIKDHYLHNVEHVKTNDIYVNRVNLETVLFSIFVIRWT